jgi:hypothetical protein
MKVRFAENVVELTPERRPLEQSSSSQIRDGFFKLRPSLISIDKIYAVIKSREPAKDERVAVHRTLFEDPVGRRYQARIIAVTP